MISAIGHCIEPIEVIFDLENGLSPVNKQAIVNSSVDLSWLRSYETIASCFHSIELCWRRHSLYYNIFCRAGGPPYVDVPCDVYWREIIIIVPGLIFIVICNVVRGIRGKQHISYWVILRSPRSIIVHAERGRGQVTTSRRPCNEAHAPCCLVLAGMRWTSIW